MFANKWQRWLKMAFRSVQETQAPSRRPKITPQVETFENRYLPSTITIVGANKFNDGPVSALTPNGPNKFTAPNLRSAVVGANNHSGDDTILLQTGTYHVTQSYGGELVIDDTYGGSLTIKPVLNAKPIIDGGHETRLFDVATGNDAFFIGLTLQHGNAVGFIPVGPVPGPGPVASVPSFDGFGGAIYNSGNLSVKGSLVTENTASGPFPGANAYGGGIFSDVNGSLSILTSTISHNKAVGADITGYGGSVNAGSAYGGGLFFSGGEGLLLISKSTIADNTAQGGNVHLGGGGGDTVLSGNGGDAYGGGLFLQRPPSTGAFAKITQSTFSGNLAQGGEFIPSGGSGPVAAYGGSVFVNGGEGSGGGLAFMRPVAFPSVPGPVAGGPVVVGPTSGDGDLQIINSTFSGNTGRSRDGFGGAGGRASRGGGLLINPQAGFRTEIVNSTIANNSVYGGEPPTFFFYGGRGGGIASFSTTSLINTLIAKNFANDFANDVYNKHVSSFESRGHNLIGDVYGGFGFSDSLGDLYGGYGGGPILDPKIGPLANNGGPTKTHALLAGSPAIDHGDNSVTLPPLSLQTDQRGLPRKSGPFVDIGAFELQQVSGIGRRQS